MHRGYIKLFRKITDWEWWDDHNTTRLFLYLLLNINHIPKKWHGIEIKEGQLLTGRKSLSKKTGLSQQQVRTSLNKLKSTSEITIKSTNKNSIITVVQYEKHHNTENTNQQNNQQINKRVTNKQPTSNQQVTTTKHYKNVEALETLKEENNLEIPIEWQHTFNTWLEYKKERSEKYKSTKTMLIAYKRLVKLSNNNLDIAKEIIEQAMASNYAGFFSLKNKGVNYGKPKFDKTIEAARAFVEEDVSSGAWESGRVKVCSSHQGDVPSLAQSDK